MTLAFQNFNIYKRLFLDVINLPDTDGPDCYRMWADLRSFLLQLVSSSAHLSCDQVFLVMLRALLSQCVMSVISV